MDVGNYFTKRFFGTQVFPIFYLLFKIKTKMIEYQKTSCKIISQPPLNNLWLLTELTDEARPFF